MGRWAILLFVLACCLARAEAGPPRVAVDVGHTLAAPGATSARGRSELEFNQALAGELVRALEARGLAVQPINGDGAIESLAARPAAAPEAELFLSLHHDSVTESELLPWHWEGRPQTYSDRWQGHSLFVSRRNPYPEASLLCASAMGARLQREGFVPTAKNARRHPWADQANTVHWYDNLVVLRLARQPAVLFEAGVIKNRDEELLLADPARRTRMAEALATGIAGCLQVLGWEATRPTGPSP
jgi:N-acetylmuramoyl-L-alanine amidase